MKEVDWIKVIEDAYKLGCRRIQFIGGEPFLRRQKLFTLIRIVKDKGYDVIEVYTNGTLINDEDLVFLKENHVSVAVSIYGAEPKIHDAITTRQGSFLKTEETIRKIIKSNIPLRIGIVEMTQNSSCIQRTIDYFKKLGVKNIKVDIVRPSGRGCKEELVDNRLLEKRLKYEASFSNCSLQKFRKAISGHNCFFDKICLSDNGDVFPCIMERRVVLGNVLQTSLTEIFNGDKAKEFRFLTKDKIETCQDCEYRYCCFDCRVMAKNLYSKPFNCLYNSSTGEWNENNKKGGDKYA
jgi:radical SAM protein with 4Fe4S-binding SPASM domain